MRLFLSVPLPDAVKDAVADIQSGLPEARWVAPDSLHLTLRFLGQVDRGTAEDLHHALAAIRAPAFPCRVLGLGTFGTGKRVRALWAGVQDAQPFKDLHHRVEAAVRRAGLAPEERKFKPHVTLARFRPGPVARLGAYLAAHGPLSQPELAAALDLTHKQVNPRVSSM